MNEKQRKPISKSLSYVLRHRPDTIGLELQEGGWVDVPVLLDAMERAGKALALEMLQTIVAECTKQRFEFSSDGSQIRARQGHSVEVDLGYEPTAPPPVLYHGTATRNLDSILADGLMKRNRHHVHLSTNKETMIQVAMRHGKPVLLAVDAARMNAAGCEFYVTGNDIWLTDHVPPEYLSVIEH
ncbi:RNA 2'-phosphotransferase [Lacipirellula parvula]|uniref:Probable RNA 2'-phosphotransferase n=1 Tax=Lacipirellula parvula TaxID=2650471 RepID=A0A5K7XKD7_9BACT|nr:RNA 2'-phosphotransferase [Lacipirellula parvula]BBO35611.1 RNA:NAD 2'-phosphotransferase [Lacipirellula parvula]